MREAQKRILAKPGLTESPTCPECGRSCYLSDWDAKAGRCVDCVTPRSAMYDDPAAGAPFLPEEE
jgi:hypothetical protein